MNIFEPWIVSNSHTEYVRDLSTQDIICAMIMNDECVKEVMGGREYNYERY